jgi:two-component system chemotaxis response regulator CheB
MIVDDSAVVRGLVSRWLSEAPDIEIVSTQRNGKMALEALAAANPDIIILDIEMPEMDGMTALPQILKQKPNTVVIMASTLTRRNAEISLKALSLGARDYIPKPEAQHGMVTADDFRRDLLDKIRALAPRGRRAPGTPAAAPASGAQTPRPRNLTAPPAAAPISLRSPSVVRPRVLLIGSSTGGPPALTSVLQTLGADGSQVPILITQHMPPTFTGILAEHLGRATGRPAAEGQDREPIAPGRIYVAPGGKHMFIEPGAVPMIRLDDGPPVNFCKPAVDPMFESAAKVYGASTLALVLTGMGHDGAEGGRAVAAAGGTVVAQDEASSVVWGMPGATARAGVCSAVLPLDRIPGQLSKYLKGIKA